MDERSVGQDEYGVAEATLGSYYTREIPTVFSSENEATLFQGDCLAFLATIPDESIQLVVTSPLYNIGKEYEEALEIDTYRAQQQVIEQCTRVLKPEGSICWQVG